MGWSRRNCIIPLSMQKWGALQIIAIYCLITREKAIIFYYVSKKLLFIHELFRKEKSFYAISLAKSTLSLGPISYYTENNKKINDGM